jgi:acyl-CoA reductase-like NAD-dependent aldehyde dehydrogenase
MTRRLQAGQVSVNFCGLADWDLPIGGHKQSGVGSENGYSGLMNYMQVKAVGIAI